MKLSHLAVLALCLVGATGYAGGGLVARSGRIAPAVVAPSRRRCAAASMEFVPGESCTGEKVVVVGATGYIGKAVVRESVARGYPTVAVVRDVDRAKSEKKFEGAKLMKADVCDAASLGQPGMPFEKGNVDVVISCLASRTGSKKDSYAIDYQATLNCLDAARAAGARHFVLLSAFCVKSAERNDKYALQFQYAKMELEAKLREQTDMTYSIIRPTAFFKSVSGQLEVVNGGAPFVYFDLGGGKCATCNPISEPDLAAALVDTIADKAKENALWNLGGPDEGLSMRQQGELVAEVLGKEEAKLLGVPIGIFDVIINGLQGASDLAEKASAFDGFPEAVPEWAREKYAQTMAGWAESLADSAEFGRIGRYYAVEDMLTTDPADKYGRTTLRQHYERIAVEGQEYDPYTSVFGSKDAKEAFKETAAK